MSQYFRSLTIERRLIDYPRSYVAENVNLQTSLKIMDLSLLEDINIWES